MKRRFINTVTVLSGICAAAVILLYAMTSSLAVACFWSVPGKRYDINVERGLLLVRQLHDYRLDTPFRWGFYEPKTPKQFAAFTDLSAWWHGDNSRWERVGYTVNTRRRLMGFEYASGQFWPPFVWQHPKVPFTVYQTPLWALIVLFMLLPLYHGIGKVAIFIRRPSVPANT